MIGMAQVSQKISVGDLIACILLHTIRHPPLPKLLFQSAKEVCVQGLQQRGDLRWNRHNPNAKSC